MGERNELVVTAMLFENEPDEERLKIEASLLGDGSLLIHQESEGDLTRWCFEESPHTVDTLVAAPAVRGLGEYFHVDIFGDPNATLVPQSGVSFKDMGDLYCLMLDHFQNSFRKVFQIFLEHLDTCVLFHCSAGKDRTGVTAALLLDLAGCHMYDIVKDYSESYENNQEIYEELLKLANNENAHYLMSDPIYMMKMI